MTRLDSNFWRNKKVLLTGHSGFKGSWLTLWLHSLGAHVTGVSLTPNTTPNLFMLAGVARFCNSHFCDIRNLGKLTTIVKDSQPEVVFHLAAQPLVRKSYQKPVDTFETNVMGTTHLLEAACGLESLRAMVMVTTDKVYRNQEWLWPYREDDALGGHDPYSASKAASELVIASYRDAFLSKQGIAVVSARAGNVIGGGDWAEDRLMPDAVRAWQADKILEIRHPEAVRPWQHVLEPLAGYLMLAQEIYSDAELAGAYNFGPDTADVASVRRVVECARAAYDNAKVSYAEAEAGPRETGWLALEIAKAQQRLGFKPCWKLAEAVERTVSWYQAQHQGADALSMCMDQIAEYQGLL